MKTTHVELETRHCTTKGCTRTFRVLTTSKQTVCSNSCSQGPYPEMAKSGAKSEGKSEDAEPAESPSAED